MTLLQNCKGEPQHIYLKNMYILYNLNLAIYYHFYNYLLLVLQSEWYTNSGTHVQK